MTKFYIIDTILGRVTATHDHEDTALEIADKYNNFEDTGRNIVTAQVKDNRNYVVNKR